MGDGLTTMGQVFAEAYRLRLMRGLEDALGDLGMLKIAGVDEAGRGCLAGPVVAGAVLVEPGKLVPGVDDSKGLSALQRERLADAIRRAHPVSAVVAVPAATIDRINILQATRLAMREAVARLSPQPDMTLIDAVRLSLPTPSLAVVRGDQISYAVACASILAKVERDHLMARLDRDFPHYAFADNKGYGSAVHREALAAFGPCGVHRLTFRSVLPKLETPSRTKRSGRAGQANAAKPKRSARSRSRAASRADSSVPSHAITSVGGA